jgi:hypothetical protein
MCTSSDGSLSINSEPTNPMKHYSNPLNSTGRDSAPPIIIKHKDAGPRRRQRFTIKQRFEIIQELKARKCSIKEIASAYKTTPRNVWRWKLIYCQYDSLTDVYLQQRETD